MRQHTWMISLSVLFLMDHAYANPTGDVVSAGAATIATNGSTLTVAQSTPRAIIDWKSFNIGANETVQFNQPNSASIALNRVDPAAGISHIQGQLQSNGQLVLINQAGIAFGKGSIVNVGGIMASTADISNAHFLNSQYQFDQSDSAHPEWGSITNQGTITAADHGLVALMGSAISNSGTITAHLGHVALASGSQFTVDFLQDGLVNFTVNQSLNKTLQGGIENTSDGTIMADGGTVLLTADLAKNTVDQAINMNGLIEANSVEQHNGTITLLGGDTGTVNVQGKITATGLQTNQTGGTVNITGNTVNIQKTAEITTNGDNGGGDINIGANPHNTGPLPTTDTLLVETDATISANAITNGNGGNITFWGEKSIIGQDGLHIASRGGAESGDGGQIESSGHGIFEVGGFASSDRAAPNGKAGTWLLDPYDLNIVSMSSVNVTANSPFTPTGSGAFLNNSSLGDALNNGSVTVQTTALRSSGSGNINIISDILDWSSSTNTLTLNAYNNIIISDTVQIGITKNNNLVLIAGGTIQDNQKNIMNLGTGRLTLASAFPSILKSTINANTIINQSGQIRLLNFNPTSSAPIIQVNSGKLILNSIPSGSPSLNVVASGAGTSILDISGASSAANSQITLNSGSSGGSAEIDIGANTTNWSTFQVQGAHNTLSIAAGGSPTIDLSNHTITGTGALSISGSALTLKGVPALSIGTLTVNAPLTWDTTLGAITINTSGNQSYGDINTQGNGNIFLTGNQITLSGTLNGHNFGNTLSLIGNRLTVGPLSQISESGKIVGPLSQISGLGKLSLAGTGSNATLDFSSYPTSITAHLSSLSTNGLASGALTNNSDVAIGTFSGINTATGSSSGDNILYTPPGQPVSVTYTSATSGYINDPFNFSYFNILSPPAPPPSNISTGPAFYYPPPIQGTNNPLLAMYSTLNLIDPILAEEIRWDQMMDVVVGCV